MLVGCLACPGVKAKLPFGHKECDLSRKLREVFTGVLSPVRTPLAENPKYGRHYQHVNNGLTVPEGRVVTSAMNDYFIRDGENRACNALSFDRRQKDRPLSKLEMEAEVYDDVDQNAGYERR